MSDLEIKLTTSKGATVYLVCKIDNKGSTGFRNIEIHDRDGKWCYVTDEKGVRISLYMRSEERIMEYYSKYKLNDSLGYILNSQPPVKN